MSARRRLRAINRRRWVVEMLLRYHAPDEDLGAIVAAAHAAHPAPCELFTTQFGGCTCDEGGQ